MVTFEQIKGYETEKKEIVNIVNMINNYQTFKEKGITLPKGLLLHGAPGVGKTLFAKAMATSLQANFIEIDFSTLETKSLLETIKEKFTEAIESSPSVILLDELDKIIPNNYYGEYHVSDESNSIINVLHNYLDGFKKRDDIFLIAIANSASMIPESLKRSGRLDKHIKIKHPDEQARNEILKYYLDSVKIEKEIEISDLVSQTYGLSGSDIKTAVNEASIEAVTKNVSLSNKLILKHIRRISGKDLMEFTEEDKNSVVAYHELGHFIVANKLKKEIIDVSIISNQNYLGRVRIREIEKTASAEDLFDIATIIVAGRAAELVFFNKKYLGGGTETLMAYELLEQSVTSGNYGNKYIKPMMATYENANGLIRKKALNLLNKAQKQAIKIVKENKQLLTKLHNELMIKGVLTGLELENYVEGSVVEKPYYQRKIRRHYE